MTLAPATEQVIVRTNCPTAGEALAIARAAVAEGLAACGNIHGPVTSIYRWAGEVVEATEHMLELKTTEAALERLEPLVRAHHSYELPAFLVLPIRAGEARYLDWIGNGSAAAVPAGRATT